MFIKPNVARFLDFQYMNRTILWNIASVENKKESKEKFFRIS